MPIPTRSVSLRDPRKQVSSPFVYPHQAPHSYRIPHCGTIAMPTATYRTVLSTTDFKYSTTCHETLPSAIRHGQLEQGVCPRDE